MRTRVPMGTLLVLFGAVLAIAQGPPKEAAQTAYRALEAEHAAELAAFQKAFQEAKTAEEQQKVYQDKHPHPAKYAPRFMEIAQKHPNSPAAVDALIWVVTHPVEPGASETKLRRERPDAASPRLHPRREAGPAVYAAGFHH